jgi:hypothetical protein
MNTAVDLTMVGFGLAGILWLGFLWLGSRLQIDRRKRTACLALGAAAVLLLFVPVAGMPLWSWAFGFCPNPSLPLLGLVVAGLCRHLGGIAVFTRVEWRQAWLFGALAGTVLYLHPFWSPADLYHWGWRDEIAGWVIAGLAVLFFVGGSRAGVLFIVALVGFEAEALESHNGWDYVVDPFYWLAGCGVLLTNAAGWWSERRRQAGSGRVAAVGVPKMRSLR